MTTTARRVALYLRVSTSGQTVENQRRELLDVAQRAGWLVVGEYVDHGVSGAKGRAKRPQLDAMLKDAARRRFDTLAAWSVDRLGRSLQDLVHMLAEMRASNVSLFLFKEGIDTTTPAGEAMYQMTGVFAQFERAMISDRVTAGLARARDEGRVGGRPRTDDAKVEQLRTALASGHSVRSAASQAGVSFGTAQRAAAALKAASKSNPGISFSCHLSAPDL